MNRRHLPQRDIGLPVSAIGEKETSINSSMPANQEDFIESEIGVCLGASVQMCAHKQIAKKSSRVNSLPEPAYSDKMLESDGKHKKIPISLLIFVLMKCTVLYSNR